MNTRRTSRFRHSEGSFGVPESRFCLGASALVRMARGNSRHRLKGAKYSGVAAGMGDSILRAGGGGGALRHFESRSNAVVLIRLASLQCPIIEQNGQNTKNCIPFKKS
jgi:hypothetical protein